MLSSHSGGSGLVQGLGVHTSSGVVVVLLVLPVLVLDVSPVVPLVVPPSVVVLLVLLLVLLLVVLLVLLLVFVLLVLPVLVPSSPGSVSAHPIQVNNANSNIPLRKAPLHWAAMLRSARDGSYTVVLMVLFGLHSKSNHQYVTLATLLSMTQQQGNVSERTMCTPSQEIPAGPRAALSGAEAVTFGEVLLCLAQGLHCSPSGP